MSPSRPAYRPVRLYSNLSEAAGRSSADSEPSSHPRSASTRPPSPVSVPSRSSLKSPQGARVSHPPYTLNPPASSPSQNSPPESMHTAADPSNSRGSSQRRDLLFQSPYCSCLSSQISVLPLRPAAQQLRKPQALSPNAKKDSSYEQPSLPRPPRGGVLARPPSLFEAQRYVQPASPHTLQTSSI